MTGETMVLTLETENGRNDPERKTIINHHAAAKMEGEKRNWRRRLPGSRADSQKAQARQAVHYLNLPSLDEAVNA